MAHLVCVLFTPVRNLRYASTEGLAALAVGPATGTTAFRPAVQRRAGRRGRRRRGSSSSIIRNPYRRAARRERRCRAKQRGSLVAAAHLSLFHAHRLPRSSRRTLDALRRCPLRAA